MAKRLIILGAGGHARVVADIARQSGWEVLGFLDDHSPERAGEPFAGAVVLGGADQLPKLQSQGAQAVVAIGNCAARLRAADQLRTIGWTLPTLVHPSAVVAPDAQVGEGTVLVAGAIVNPGAWVGRDVILNTACSVDHDCRVGDGAHLSPGARLAGGVEIGRGTWIGMGTVVREKVRVGAGSVIGAGSVVLANIADGVVAYGAPARVVRMLAGD